MDKPEPYRPKFGVDIRIRPPEEPQPVCGRACAWPGCKSEGAHPAPKSRDDLQARVWYCLDHVREFNKNWNFFDGWADEAVRAYQVADTIGHRPTWRFGEAGKRPDLKVHFRQRTRRFDDPFSFFGGTAHAKEPEVAPGLTQRQAKAFDLFSLDRSADKAEIRRRYTLLVKRFHPDANDGDRAREEQLRAVIDAYQVLRNGGFC